LSFDLDAALRWLKPSRKRRPLRRRPDEELSWIDAVPAMGGPVLLDTTVYIDALQGRSPDSLDALISVRTCNHSSVCLSELTHAFGRLNPDDPRTQRSLELISRTVRDVPSHRLVAPDTATWGAAGILGGLLFRLGCYAAGAERRCVNDALIFLQGRSNGWLVVTRNVSDFEFLNQLVPDGRILLYRQVEH